MDKELKKNKFNNFSTAQILTLGFIGIILIGSFILTLPICLNEGIKLSYLDSLFISTSSVCVTGLTTQNIVETFSIFGRFMIIFLVQIGGLGFMSFVTLIYIILNKKISLRNKLVIEESTNLLDGTNMLKVIKYIIIFTFIVEFIGAMLLSVSFVPIYGPFPGLCKAFFHSIAAFCNAGFDTIGYSSLTPLATDYLFNFTIMGLIILGGLGFFVIFDIYKKFNMGIKEKLTFRNTIKKLSVHSKIVIITSLTLMIAGTLFIYVIESFNPNTIEAYNVFDRLLISLFQSVSARTAGFTTMNLMQGFETSKFIYIILMFIGGSPSSTAGGIKTTTIALLGASVYSMLKNETDTTMWGKTIPNELIRKAMVIFFLGIAYVIVSVMILITVENCDITVAGFEIVSAFATVGVTLGLTAKLSFLGKIIIIITMFVGRLGVLTLATLMISRQNSKPKDIIKYPEEKVLLG